MHAVHVAIAAAALLAAGQASAAAIDLSKPYGNKSGCINKNGQQVYAEDMLLLTDKEFITVASACTFTEKQAQADGSLVVKSLCDAEGEEGQSPIQFTIRRSLKNAKRLVIADEDGMVMGEVSRCR
ncbi:MAG: hypothetical protein EOS20_33780 [Mesorhizobium sp.]|uniref:hypothetical protein n=1 Tax=unclassified Mesorhizobium TaxID=325217 RepID=UPI000FD2C66A|nr:MULTISPECIES: hypothetical protein [unclassified Mesorhizobium]RVB73751.1 hypothetical protein EN885_25095 [Mesorhizobium sp. M6A.T.Cr.TU.014.01.1.1]RWP81428.1 MAG: hypothetical protein EOR10_05265 [Mesorhizobium sp.]RWQ02611.1 MAG: hypothetical protein EOR91_21140 [Mesorhizobium sp.]RWQ06373.1 MAG: hypothetical protein EOR90_13085 [Mesorhizobium sp.]RWQ28866.1 MAG: hypothetical protein EOS20_33780 [Mesorhizobium sp.]